MGQEDYLGGSLPCKAPSETVQPPRSDKSAPFIIRLHPRPHNHSSVLGLHHPKPQEFPSLPLKAYLHVLCPDWASGLLYLLSASLPVRETKSPDSKRLPDCRCAQGREDGARTRPTGWAGMRTLGPAKSLGTQVFSRGDPQAHLWRALGPKGPCKKAPSVTCSQCSNDRTLTGKHNFWISDMAQRVKVLGAKLDEQRLIPQIYLFSLSK